MPATKETRAEAQARKLEEKKVLAEDGMVKFLSLGPRPLERVLEAGKKASKLPPEMLKEVLHERLLERDNAFLSGSNYVSLTPPEKPAPAPESGVVVIDRSGFVSEELARTSRHHRMVYLMQVQNARLQIEIEELLKPLELLGDWIPSAFFMGHLNDLKFKYANDIRQLRANFADWATSGAKELGKWEERCVKRPMERAIMPEELVDIWEGFEAGCAKYNDRREQFQEAWRILRPKFEEWSREREERSSFTAEDLAFAVAVAEEDDS